MAIILLSIIEVKNDNQKHSILNDFENKEQQYDEKCD